MRQEAFKKLVEHDNQGQILCKLFGYLESCEDHKSHVSAKKILDLIERELDIRS